VEGRGAGAAAIKKKPGVFFIDGGSGTPQTRSRYLFYIAALDQSYWVAGSLIGAVAGTLIPVSMEGISFSLTALFIVLAIEQIIPLLRKQPPLS
jgi:predicted branched-subunit amino acid permease